MPKLEGLSGIFEKLSVFQTPISVADPELDDCPLIYVNKPFQRLTGYNEDDVIGRNCRFLQGPETDIKAVARIKESLDQNVSTLHCLKNYDADGRPFHNLLVMSRVHSEYGDIVIGCQSSFKLAGSMLIRRQIEAAEGVLTFLRNIGNNHVSLINDTMQARSRSITMLVENYIDVELRRRA